MKEVDEALLARTPTILLAETSLERSSPHYETYLLLLRQLADRHDVEVLSLGGSMRHLRTTSAVGPVVLLRFFSVSSFDAFLADAQFGLLDELHCGDGQALRLTALEGLRAPLPIPFP